MDARVIPTEPASFAFLAGETTVVEYREQRDAVLNARSAIVEILLLAKKRLAKAGLGSVGSLRILCDMLTEYYREWGIIR